ncbi:hypothetical protein MNBD_NITROSPINAE03-286 [hydrothermal vent metagenome]|uniref:Uncharacterized protein n=1 Tax=hydrothermal vent metagenome TaxID=652676 RepID=A0A3B1CFF8_9ZZZZ
MVWSFAENTFRKTKRRIIWKPLNRYDREAGCEDE